jgi:hypothetical protein
MFLRDLTFAKGGAPEQKWNWMCIPRPRAGTIRNNEHFSFLMTVPTCLMMMMV